MPDFLDEVASNAPIPEQWRAQESVVDGVTSITTGPLAQSQDALAKSDEELLRGFGYDPDEIELIGTINQWRKQQPDGTWRVSYYWRHRPRGHKLDLPALYAETRRIRPTTAKQHTGESTLVVCWSDPQIGKRDHRGGTPELLARLEEKRALLSAEIRRRRHVDSFAFLDLGDGPESFENVKSQYFTNDLSFPQQLDVYATEVMKFLTLLAKHGPVQDAVIQSNHGAWREGKQTLGRPEDDWGIHVHHQVQKIVEAKGLPVSFHYPPPYIESMILDVRGTAVGLVHGHQNGSPDQFPNWWAGQVHGGQPVALADIVLSGHFHHLRIQPTGRNVQTQKSKWWIQLPPLDNGSAWFANRRGDESDPGMVIFEIDEDGFNLQSLTVL